MSKEMPPPSLKDKNRWQLWLTIAANFAVFYAVAQSDAIASSGLKGLLIGAANLLPIGAALVVTSIANGLLSAGMKARLVFLRWHYALPGHRAFSVHASADPRIDLNRLKEALGSDFPITAEEQNRIWYQLYKEIEYDSAISHIHREFLFSRDYACFAFLFLIGFGTASIFLSQSPKIFIGYCIVLLVQFLLARRAAVTYGIRLVTTVLARKAT